MIRTFGIRAVALASASLLMVLACGQQTTSTQQAAKPPGVTDKEIVIGGTYPLSGATAAYAAIPAGLQAYFKYINTEKGGVNGRQIRHIVYDDAYDATQTVPKLHQLVEQDKVFAVFQTLGTNPSTAGREYLNDQKVPQLFVATGASKWGDANETKKYPWTIGWQPDYISEGKIYAKNILANTPNAKIGVLYQNDDYGKDYLTGLEQGLGSKASMIIDKQTYEANATDVSSQVVALKNKGADVFYLAATPAQSVSALVTMASVQWKPQVYLNSVSTSQTYMKAVIAKLGGSQAGTEGVISTIYTKDPTDPAWDNDAGMQQYKSLLAKYCPVAAGCDYKNGFYLYGFAVGYTFVDMLTKAGKDLTRQKVMDTARNLSEAPASNPWLLPEIKVETNKSNQYPITQEQLMTYKAGLWVRSGRVIDARG
jgi:branched-chain amino acid transport system substrate-binding protein